MSDSLKLFDLHSKAGPKAWSINPWKSRMLLNYKGLPYTTQWVEVCDVESVLKPLGVPPNEGNRPYTIPALDLGGGEMVMDSWKIAQAVEKKFPSPPVVLNTPEQKTVEDSLGAMFTFLVPVFGPRIQGKHFTDRSQKWFLENRLPPGTSLEELDKVGRSDKPWEDVRPHMQVVAAALKQNTEGPFFQGKTFTYADILWATFIHFFKCADEEIFQKALSFDDVFREHYTACEQWLQKDS